MTDFCQTVSMSFFSADAIEVPQALLHFETLSSRVIPDPTLRNLSVSCMGFLRDVAASQQRKQAFFALNFRNVIDIQPLRGCKKSVLY